MSIYDGYPKPGELLENERTTLAFLKSSSFCREHFGDLHSNSAACLQRTTRAAEDLRKTKDSLKKLSFEAFCPVMQGRHVLRI